MRPRPLATENRILRVIAPDEIGVSLGRAVTAMADTPMTGTLIARAFEQAGAASTALTEDQREEFAQGERDRRNRQAAIEYELDYTTDPALREQLFSKLDAIYQESETQRNSIFQQSIDEGRLKTPEYLNEKYGEYGLKFEEYGTEEEARLLNEGKKEEAIRNAILSRSPTGFVPGVAKFAGGMLAMATDPVEVATMFIPFVGQAGKAAAVARFGRVGGRAGVGAIEGTAGALLTEPLYYALSKDQQLDYSMSEALLNVGAGLFLGGAIGTVKGVWDTRNVDVKAVLEASEPEVSVRSDLQPNPIPERVSEAQIAENKRRAAKQAREMYNTTGGRITYETAIRQFVTDQGVNVSMVAPKPVARPQTLSEFIRMHGGINDQDPTFRGELKNLGIEGRAGYLNSKGNMVNGISNRTTNTNLDDMAEMAFEAGFLPERSPNQLIDALSEESRGNFTFARQDLEQADAWRAYSAAKNDYEAEISRREDIRSELETFGQKDVTDEEVALISERMAVTGDDVIDAAQSVSIKVEDVRAELAARHAMDIENDPFADLQASARFDEVGDEIELDEGISQQEAIIAQMREDGELTKEQLEEIQEIEQIDARTDAYIEVTEAVTVCIARA